jgi:hypothetical protein
MSVPHFWTRYRGAVPLLILLVLVLACVQWSRYTAKLQRVISEPDTLGKSVGRACHVFASVF